MTRIRVDGRILGHGASDTESDGVVGPEDLPNDVALKEELRHDILVDPIDLTDLC